MDSFLSLLQSPTAVALSAGLLMTLPVGLLVTLVLFLVLKGLTPRQAELRYGLCLAGLFCVFGSGVLTTTWLFEFPESPRRLQTQLLTSLATEPATPVTPAAGTTSAAPVSSRPSGRLANTGSQPWSALAFGWFLRLSPWLTAFWLVGAHFFMGRALIVLLADQRVLRAAQPLDDRDLMQQIQGWAKVLGLKRVPRVLVGESVTGPAVHGWWRSTLLLPVSFATRFPPDQIEVMILHELAHIRRHDYLVNLVQMLIDAVLFFNPMVWWLNRQIRLERESCCDQAATQQCSAVSLAHALAGLAGAVAPPVTATQPLGGFPRGSLLNRIQRLVSPERRPTLHLTLKQCASFMFSWGLGLLFLFMVSRQAALLAGPFWTPDTYEEMTERHAEGELAVRGLESLDHLHIVDPEGRTYVLRETREVISSKGYRQGRLFMGLRRPTLIFTGFGRAVTLVPLEEAGDFPVQSGHLLKALRRRDLFWLSVPGYNMAHLALNGLEQDGHIAEMNLNQVDLLNFQIADEAGAPITGQEVFLEVWIKAPTDLEYGVPSKRSARSRRVRRLVTRSNEAGRLMVAGTVPKAERGNYRFYVAAPGRKPILVDGEGLEGETLRLADLQTMQVVLRDEQGHPIPNGWVRIRSYQTDQNGKWFEPEMGYVDTNREGRGEIGFPVEAKTVVVQAGVDEPRREMRAFDKGFDTRQAVAVVPVDHNEPLVLTLKNYSLDIEVTCASCTTTTAPAHRRNYLWLEVYREGVDGPEKLFRWGGLQLDEKGALKDGPLGGGLPGTLLRLNHPFGERLVKPDADGVYRAAWEETGMDPIEPKVPLRQATLRFEVPEGAALPTGKVRLHWVLDDSRDYEAWNRLESEGFWPRDRVDFANFSFDKRSGASRAMMQVSVRDGRAVFQIPSGVTLDINQVLLVGYQYIGPDFLKLETPEGTGDLQYAFETRRSGMISVETRLPEHLSKSVYTGKERVYQSARFVTPGEDGVMWVPTLDLEGANPASTPLRAESVQFQEGGGLFLRSNVPLDVTMRAVVQLNGLVLVSEPFTATRENPSPTVSFDWDGEWVSLDVETTHQGQPVSFFKEGNVVGWPRGTFIFDAKYIHTNRLVVPKAWAGHISFGYDLGGWALTRPTFIPETRRELGPAWLYFNRRYPLEAGPTRHTFELSLFPLPTETKLRIMNWSDGMSRNWVLLWSERIEQDVVILEPLYLAVDLRGRDQDPPQFDLETPLRVFLKKTESHFPAFTRYIPRLRRTVIGRQREHFEAAQEAGPTLMNLNLTQAETLVNHRLWRFKTMPLRIHRDTLAGAVLAVDPDTTRLEKDAYYPDTNFQYSKEYLGLK